MAVFFVILIIGWSEFIQPQFLRSQKDVSFAQSKQKIKHPITINSNNLSSLSGSGKFVAAIPDQKEHLNNSNETLSNIQKELDTMLVDPVLIDFQQLDTVFERLQNLPGKSGVLSTLDFSAMRRNMKIVEQMNEIEKKIQTESAKGEAADQQLLKESIGKLHNLQQQLDFSFLKDTLAELNVSGNKD
ncbi:MAG: hypothetical protein RQ715_07010 [Methylococcales bacterium]|nr:hypothetical protein [Methylococcales bacterium]